ncbi:MAG: ribosome maturation factor RimM [Chitinophagales bacterium]
MNNLVEIGYIQKPHGYKGEVKVKFYDDILIDPESINAIFVKKNSEQLPFFIETFQFIGNQNAIIKFEELDSKESAQVYKSGKLFLEEDKFERLLDDENASHQYIGFTIKDVHHGHIGIVEDVYEFPHQDLLSVQYQNKEILIPFQEDLIEEFQIEQKIILSTYRKDF